MDSNSVNIMTAFGAAIIGGALAGGFALLGVILNYKKDLERQRQNQKNNLKGFYQAVLTEGETIWEAYMSGGIGEILDKLPDEQPFEFFFPFSTEAFPVYKANLHLIGQIPDPKLRLLLVRTYAQGQSIIDSTIYNNNSLSKKEQWDWMYYKTKDRFYKDLLEAEKKGMVEYAKGMRKQHNELKNNVVELLEKLKKALCDD